MFDSGLQELPCGQPSSLEPRARLVHVDEEPSALLLRDAHRRHRGPVVDRRERPGVTVRQDPRAVPDQLGPMLADLSTPLDVVSGVPFRGRDQVLSPRGGRHHRINRIEQILARGSRFPEAVGDSLQVESLFAGLSHAVRGGRSDGGRPPDHHVLDGDRDVLVCLRLVDPDVERKVPLIDQLHHAVLEPHGLELARDALDRDVQPSPPTDAAGTKAGSTALVGRVPASCRV